MKRKILCELDLDQEFKGAKKKQKEGEFKDNNNNNKIKNKEKTKLKKDAVVNIKTNKKNNTEKKNKNKNKNKDKIPESWHDFEENKSLPTQLSSLNDSKKINNTEEQTTKKTRVLSIDLGSTNLGKCDIVFQGKEFSFLCWEIVHLCEGIEKGTVATDLLLAHVDQVINISSQNGLNRILIEEQPPINIKTVQMSFAIYGYFIATRNIIASSNHLAKTDGEKKNENKFSLSSYSSVLPSLSSSSSSSCSCSCSSCSSCSCSSCSCSCSCSSCSSSCSSSSFSSSLSVKSCKSTSIYHSGLARNADSNSNGNIILYSSNPPFEVVFINSIKKLDLCYQVGADVEKTISDNHRYNKKLAINAVTIILKHYNKLDVLQWFLKQKKKDDLADCFLQALWDYSTNHPNFLPHDLLGRNNKQCKKIKSTRRKLVKLINAPCGQLQLER